MTESYYNIRSQLKTGDLIFFRGADGVSNLISKIEKKFVEMDSGHMSV